MLIGKVTIIPGGQETLFAGRQVNEKLDPPRHGIPVARGIRRLTMAEKAKQGEGGHGGLVMITPRAILVLLALEKIERFLHGIRDLRSVARTGDGSLAGRSRIVA